MAAEPLQNAEQETPCAHVWRSSWWGQVIRPPMGGGETCPLGSHLLKLWFLLLLELHQQTGKLHGTFWILNASPSHKFHVCKTCFLANVMLGSRVSLEEVVSSQQTLKGWFRTPIPVTLCEMPSNEKLCSTTHSHIWSSGSPQHKYSPKSNGHGRDA